MSRIVVGFTGAFGSGCSFIADNFFVNNKNYKKFSLSKVLKEVYLKEKKLPSKESISRTQLQEFGNKKRKNNIIFLAEKVCEMIDSQSKDEDCIVIDSIRNPYEIDFLREKFPQIIIIGIFADYDTRWNRVKDKYNNSKDDFDKDEFKDKGVLEPKHGQKISDCFFMADLILSNDKNINCDGEYNTAYHEMESKINGYMQAFEDPTKSNPTNEEIQMATAYANGRRSKCIKRKVGAVITDEYNRVMSSGFNGVPMGLSECKSLYGKCYRDIKRKEISKKISKEIDSVDQEQLKNSVYKNVKLLELCRAMHAEESAIIGLAGKGVPLEKSTLYATTYPCNLCANKIAQVKIAKVIYFEPYPVGEAKDIFKEADVKTKPFEGVTFRAFFRAFNYEP